MLRFKALSLRKFKAFFANQADVVLPINAVLKTTTSFTASLVVLCAL